MISALRRWSASSPSAVSRFRATGSGTVGVQNSKAVTAARTRVGVLPFGTGAAFELRDEDIEERFVKASVLKSMMSSNF